MLAVTFSPTDRGTIATILPATLLMVLLVASVHFHVLCNVVCFHDAAEMTADICHGMTDGQ